ncbi:MAG TPA: hypothetical protein VK753_13495 [Xanthomonadaceae bacterium]|nr:hypothetical protein [Xanthomonadaceae bacterium]
MTQTPQLPPQLPPEPLDAAERDLARMLRNLPSGSPSPELDARILGVARRAVHQAQPRKLHWGRSIGIGTAASALLAVGLFVKMHGAGENLQPETPPAAVKMINAPAAAARTEAEAAAPAGQPAAAENSVMAPKEIATSPPPPPVVTENEMPMSAPAPRMLRVSPSPPPPPMEMPARAEASGALVAKPSPNAFPFAPAPAPAAPAINPPSPQAPVVMQESQPESVAAPAPVPPPADGRGEDKAESFTAARQDAQNQAAAATPPAQGLLDKKDAAQSQAEMKSAPAASGYANPNATTSTTDGTKAKNLDMITVTGSRVRRVDTETASPVLRLSRDELSAIDDDAKLAPMQWIERIRARMKADDDGGARESLRRFHVRYPDAAIPDDLQPLLH